MRNSTRTRSKAKAGRKKPVVQKPRHAWESEIDLCDIYPSPENDNLYKPVDPNDPAIIELTNSIRERGILEPLAVTDDMYIVSGHRRFAAANLAGLDTVPCKVLPIRRRDDIDAFIRLLREHNIQRVKSFDEVLREQVVAADPDIAYLALIARREEKARLVIPALEIEGRKHRSQISKNKRPFMRAIVNAVNGLREYWPISDRKVFYELLNDPPLRYATRPESLFANNDASYNDLTDMLTRMRIFGDIPMEAIGDETRPVTLWVAHRNSGNYIYGEVNDFLGGYCRDKLQSQPNHIELLIEKNTLAGMVERVAGRYGMPMTSGRGFSSLPPRNEIAKRFAASGKSKLVLLIVTDHDPDGMIIAHSFARSMRDDFRIQDIHAIKVALTAEQVVDYKLPVGGQAKKTSTNYNKFKERYGDNAYEVEALRPDDLQHIVQEAIDSVLDIEAFNRELEQERIDAAHIETVRRKVQHVLANIGLGEAEAAQ